MSEIAIAAFIVGHLPEEIQALEFVAKLAGQVIQSIENRRAGNPTPLPITGEQAWQILLDMQKAQAATTTT
jgi:hypothetical protein